MFPRNLSFAGDVDPLHTSDSARTMMITWTRVHAIINGARARNGHLSGRLDGRHVEWSESSDHHRGSPVIDFDRGLPQDAGTIVIFIERMAPWVLGTFRSPSDGWQKSINVIAGRSRSDGHDALDLSLTLATHLDDWILIERAASWGTLCAIVHSPKAIGWQRLKLNHDHGSRSRFDRGPIAPRSGLIHRQIGADSSRDWSHDQRQGNRSHDPFNPLPRPHQSATIFGPKSPLKASILPSCSWTFDREFLFDFIEFSPWIPNVHEEESEKICFNPQELNPILTEIGLVERFDRLSRGNLSFY